MVALIDADSIAYKIGYTHQDVDVDHPGIVTGAVDNYVENVLRAVNSTHYHGFLGTNHKPVFRHKIDKEYKGNRNKALPEWMEKWGMVVKNRLVYKHKFLITMGIEAEDGVGIYAAHYRKNKVEHCICSVDKDLQQIPGKHYNYTKEVWTEVKPHEASQNLWVQVLMGDSTDNIKGIPGVGDKTARKIIFNAPWPAGNIKEHEAYRNAVLQEYVNRMGEHLGIWEFAKNYGLVKLLDEAPEGFDIVDPHEFAENLI